MFERNLPPADEIDEPGFKEAGKNLCDEDKIMRVNPSGETGCPVSSWKLNQMISGGCGMTSTCDDGMLIKKMRPITRVRKFSQPVPHGML